MKVETIKFANISLEKSFNELKEKDFLRKSIIKAVRNIKYNYPCGRNVRKRLIPKVLITKYQINNLWIYNLPLGWRLLYSLTSNCEIKLVAVLLDWMNHKDYERLFNF